jgi:EAL domain-containing protein (putative c-di-GMP-specific phosphodiesterase class I)
VEITETGLIGDIGGVVTVLNQLRSLGVRVAVDDFGAGQSALGYLKQLPVDLLKIDKSFVQDLLRSPRDAALVRSTIELAHSLELDVVAEGVEDQATLERLAALGCDLAQGYYVSRPLPPERLLAWLQQASWGEATFASCPAEHESAA